MIRGTYTKFLPQVSTCHQAIVETMVHGITSLLIASIFQFKLERYIVTSDQIPIARKAKYPCSGSTRSIVTGAKIAERP